MCIYLTLSDKLDIIYLQTIKGHNMNKIDTIGILVKPITNKDRQGVTIEITYIDMSKLKDGQSQLERIYELISCSNIDIVRSKLGDIWIDDEGLYVEANPVISFNEDNKSLPLRLAGNLLFSKGLNDEGETIWFNLDKVTDLAKVKDIEEAFKYYSLLGFVHT